MMKTSHRVIVGDSRSLTGIADDSVALVVTSPPYPMIEMWDELFADLAPEVKDRLAAGAGREAFELMHEALDRVWEEVARVLVDGGIACINVGDATRKVDGSFRVYQNHARIINAFEALGFEPLPEILWRKPVNSAAKFMGSGMLPPNAYVTLEHEYILVFRNGKTHRAFEPKADRRYNAAFFWEERNKWFSDVWMDVKGELQELDSHALRDRSAAYPFEIPYRLINMYSVYGDTVLDPFWGTGTTSLAAVTAARNSIGVELQEDFITVFENRMTSAPEYARSVINNRIKSHREFAKNRVADGTEMKYTAKYYAFPVVTKQEIPIRFYAPSDIEKTGNTYTVTHHPVKETQNPEEYEIEKSGVKQLSDFSH